MGRTINEDDVIEIVKFECGDWVGLAKTIENKTNALPSAQQWIPCSERLPEYGEDVLAYMKGDDYYINHIIDDEIGEWLFDDVLAWMPLPEPWKGEQE